MNSLDGKNAMLEPLEDRIDTLFKELELAVKWDRPSILLSVYGSEYVYEEAAAALENQLIDLGQKVIWLQFRQADTHQVIARLTAPPAAPNQVYFVAGLRWSVRRGDLSAYQALNQARETFVSNRVRVVFWLTENEASDMAHHAPDYWAFRHRVVEFVESPKPEQILQRALETTWQVAGEYTDSLEDTDQKISLRSSLLNDLPDTAESTANRASLLLTLGILHWRKGSYEKAAELLHSSLALAEVVGDAWLQAACHNAIALVQTELDQTDEAIVSYQEAIRLAPEQIFAWANLGSLYLKLNQDTEALAAFKKAVEYNPSDPTSWNGLGNAHYKLSQFREAIAAYKRSVELSPGFANPWNGLGHIYTQAGDLRSAITAYEKAVQISPRFTSAWVCLGQIYEGQADTHNALRAYWNAVRLDTRNAEIWNAIGNVYFNAESHEEALRAYHKAIQLDRTAKISYANLAIASSRTGRHQDAEMYFKKSIELLGRVPEGMSEPAGSPEPVQPISELVPHLEITPAPAAEVLHALEAELQQIPVRGEVDRLQGNTSEPEDTHGPANRKEAQEIIHPDLPEEENQMPILNTSTALSDAASREMDARAWHEVGNLHFNAGNYPEAVAAYERTIESDPNFEQAYNNLAFCYSQLGQREKAIPLYQKMIEFMQGKADEPSPSAPTQKGTGPLNALPLEEKSNGGVFREETISAVQQVSVAAIQPNPYQPRKVGDVSSLVESVRKLGIVMPLVVMPADAPAQYCLIAGARRLEAARQVGLQTVPAIVRSAAELERMEQDLVEAARRTDLNPLVLANLYERLNAELSLAIEDIASLVGRSTSSVSETLRLLKLNDKVKAALSQGRITYEHARNLLWLSTPQAQNIALQHILDRGMSAAQTELFVRNSLGGQAIAASGNAEIAPETIHMEERLVDEFISPRDEEFESQREDRPGAALVARTRALLMSNRAVQPSNAA